MSEAGESAVLAKVFLEIVPHSMWAVRYEVRRAASKRSRGALSVPQIRVLAQLRRRAFTNGELAERLGVSVPCMSRLVDGLARRGLVSRVAEKNDRRRVDLKLSPAGRRYFTSVMKTVEDRFADQFAKLDADRSAVLKAGLGILGEVIR